MKNVSRRKKENKYSNNGNGNGGVRYIKKILERIVSRINLQLFEKEDFRKSRTKSSLLEKNRAKNDNVLTIDEKIINEIINK